MKKKSFLLLSTLTALVICGCSAQSVSNMSNTEAVDTTVGDEAKTSVESDNAIALLSDCTTNEYDQRKAECLDQAQYGDILDTTWWNSPLAPEIIIDDYVSGRREYIDYYYTVDADGWVYTDTFYGKEQVRSRVYYPAATIDGETWNADELVDGYFDQTLPWAQLGYSDAVLYTSDYRMCFRIRQDGWFYANDVRVRPIYDFSVCVEEPIEVLDYYQHGWWDGTIPMYSIDYGTMVEVGQDGALKYTYQSIEYSDEYDAEHLAYRKYADPPAFMTTGTYDGGFGVICSNRSGLTVDENRKVKSFKAEVEVYVDLPDGTKDGFDEAAQFYYVSPEIGMYVVMPDRTELYRRGVLLDAWYYDARNVILSDSSDYFDASSLYYYDPDDEESLWMTYCEINDATYLIVSDKTILRLLPEGKIQIVLDDVIDSYSIGEYYGLMYLSLKDSKLTGYSLYYGKFNLGEGIASVDYTHDILLMTGEDGMCYAIFEDDYVFIESLARDGIKSGTDVTDMTSGLNPYCLGSKSWQHYRDLYYAGLLEKPTCD